MRSALGSATASLWSTKFAYFNEIIGSGRSPRPSSALASHHRLEDVPGEDAHHLGLLGHDGVSERPHAVLVARAAGPHPGGLPCVRGGVAGRRPGHAVQAAASVQPTGKPIRASSHSGFRRSPGAVPYSTCSASGRLFLVKMASETRPERVSLARGVAHKRTASARLWPPCRRGPELVRRASAASRVGHPRDDEDPLPEVRCAHVGSSKAAPRCIQPAVGQLPENDVEAPNKEA